METNQDIYDYLPGCPRVNPIASGGAGKRTPGHVRLQRHRDAGGADWWRWRWRWCQTHRTVVATVMEIMGLSENG